MSYEDSRCPCGDKKLPGITVITGDCLEQLRTLPDSSVHCCVTSPPYWGLRDYGTDGQLGLEATPEEYVRAMVSVFDRVWRVLRDDGTLWLNLGDSYSGGKTGRDDKNDGGGLYAGRQKGRTGDETRNRPVPEGLKPKDLVGIPWRVAFALQADGWYLRQDIIWHKPNPMPESVTDRCTKSHEYIFLLTKSAKYFYDAEAVKEQSETTSIFHGSLTSKSGANGDRNAGGRCGVGDDVGTRNKRSVWTVPSAPYSEAHFATFPPNLIKPCILAGTSARGCCPKCGAPWERVVESNNPPNDGVTKSRYQEGMAANRLAMKRQAARERGEEFVNRTVTTGWQPTCECGETTTQPCTVLDPFGGSGTTGKVALEFGRNAVLIELNPDYVKLIEKRCHITPGLLI